MMALVVDHRARHFMADRMASGIDIPDKDQGYYQMRNVPHAGSFRSYYSISKAWRKA